MRMRRKSLAIFSAGFLACVALVACVGLLSASWFSKRATPVRARGLEIMAIQVRIVSLTSSQTDAWSM